MGLTHTALSLVYTPDDRFLITETILYIQAEYDEYNEYSNNSIEKMPEYKVTTGLGKTQP